MDLLAADGLVRVSTLAAADVCQGRSVDGQSETVGASASADVVREEVLVGGEARRWLRVGARVVVQVVCCSGGSVSVVPAVEQ